MRTKAIIIKKQRTKEFDQLVTCYTQELGKFTGIAKSSLKPHSVQGMHLDSFNLVEFDIINGRATPIITGAQCEYTFPHIRESLPRQAAAYFFLEVIDRVAYDHQQDDPLWNFLTNLLRELETISEPELMPWFRQKQADFLKVLGHPSQAQTIGVLAADPASLDATYEYIFGIQLNSLQFLYKIT